MNSMWAIVPYKEPPSGKSRLSDRLTLKQRELLASTMLEVVVDACLRAKLVSGILLVSDSPQLAKFTSETNTIVLETQTSNLKDAITQACCFASDQLNCSTTFVVPADLPLISAQDIDYAVTRHTQITLIPDRRLKGTNGVISTPPNAFEYVFNGQSFQAHQQNARATGLETRVLQIETFSCDVDTFEDLMKVLHVQPDSSIAKVYSSFVEPHSPQIASN